MVPHPGDEDIDHVPLKDFPGQAYRGLLSAAVPMYNRLHIQKLRMAPQSRKLNNLLLNGHQLQPAVSDSFERIPRIISQCR